MMSEGAEVKDAPRTLKREDIRIRAATVADAPAIQEITCGPKAVWGTLNMHHTSVDMWTKVLSALADGVTVLVAEVDGKVVAEGELMANPRISPRSHALSVAVCVHDDWQGLGLGRAMMTELVSYAENWMNIQRVELVVWAENTKAIALYEKLGFVKEGLLKDYVFRDGKLVDAVFMARMRPPRK